MRGLFLFLASLLVAAAQTEAKTPCDVEQQALASAYFDLFDGMVAENSDSAASKETGEGSGWVLYPEPGTVRDRFEISMHIQSAYFEEVAEQGALETAFANVVITNDDLLNCLKAILTGSHDTADKELVAGFERQMPLADRKKLRMMAENAL